MSSLESGKLLEYPELGLRILAGENGLYREIHNEDVNRPGLALAGFYRNFAHDRLQVFGQGEYAYLTDCGDQVEDRIKEEFFQYEFPALVFTHANQPPACFIEKANQLDIPLLQTTLTTHDFILNFNRFITRALAPRTSRHGVLIEVFGLGVLLLGPSGIGKSETALELIERGHRLVADDMVHIRHMGRGELIGESDPMIEHHMELRGIGIVNIKDLFGVGAIRKKVQVDLVVFLEDWNEEKEYDRLGIDEETMEILGVAIPSITLPLRPGRNIPILVETASMNHRSRRMGFHAARSLSERIHTRISEQIVPDPGSTPSFPASQGRSSATHRASPGNPDGGPGDGHSGRSNSGNSSSGGSSSGGNRDAGSSRSGNDDGGSSNSGGGTSAGENTAEKQSETWRKGPSTTRNAESKSADGKGKPSRTSRTESTSPESTHRDGDSGKRRNPAKPRPLMGPI